MIRQHVADALDYTESRTPHLHGHKCDANDATERQAVKRNSASAADGAVPLRCRPYILIAQFDGTTESNKHQYIHAQIGRRVRPAAHRV